VAVNIDMLIAARAIQGIGGGGKRSKLIVHGSEADLTNKV
jgi:hypothetical protein